jgi:hypothetical protein
MPFGDETTAGVHHVFASVSVVTAIDQFSCFSRRTKAQSFVSYQLVGGKTVVEFDNLNVGRVGVGLAE